ncbi:hypothetical protein F5B17DRAFT_415004 [Nemania serpens]|nr:hypothetical protein F5B17DRAFT_415004 [Nemania serpens]
MMMDMPEKGIFYTFQFWALFGIVSPIRTTLGVSECVWTGYFGEWHGMGWIVFRLVFTWRRDAVKKEQNGNRSHE